MVSGLHYFFYPLIYAGSLVCPLCFIALPANVLGLCEEADLEAQMFVLSQMFIRIPNVQFSTEPAFLQNPC